MERNNAKQVADMLGFTTTNLKYYASLLEQNGLEIYRNTRNHREYTQQDIKILRAMQYLNREKSMPLEDAASFVMSSDTDIDDILAQKLAPEITKNDANISILKQESDNQLRLLTHLSSLLAEQIAMREEIKEMKQTFKEIAITQNDFQNILLSLEQQRLERFNMMITERRVIKKLEKEAFDLWCEKPLEERLIKVGWFRKIEDVNKRNSFIKEYVDRHYEKRMKKEYELD
ncbi:MULTISPECIES: MerR family transcriptional regulator [Bacillales]|uniref:MerR family transcriptional regulator n=1 Tax=Lysinibacillus halotolerans TaxID=1368476 RepID=A0A3M8H2J5_9BACI|nr:MerR family transcriptional regulator [Lysinibacillus halotolerans]RNC96200.1 MerR family transcriptional regulator [Lysinibacillus halotolerans]